jgi:hypothetical protein
MIESMCEALAIAFNTISNMDFGRIKIKIDESEDTEDER